MSGKNVLNGATIGDENNESINITVRNLLTGVIAPQRYKQLLSDGLDLYFLLSFTLSAQLTSLLRMSNISIR